MSCSVQINDAWWVTADGVVSALYMKGYAPGCAELQVEVDCDKDLQVSVLVDQVVFFWEATLALTTPHECGCGVTATAIARCVREIGQAVPPALPPCEP